ncbi:hypothetical protein Q9L58_004980 [Maublancomyces gigas]|uniref:Uncharacterized protein n=1 Tax=Discina gigas TaxID=1032678 RepID=A0ABR3GJG2_9PEZI
MASRSLRSPIVRTVVNSVQRLYARPREIIVLLLEAPHRADKPTPRRHVVLLAIDLTRAVVDEALAIPASMIVSYHPIIFRPLKSFTFADSQQESLLRLTQEGISVYSPHTAVDATIGGVNDWLVDGISGGKQNEQSRTVLVPVEGPVGFESSGMGRLVTLTEATSLMTLVDRVKEHVKMPRVMVAATAEHMSGSSAIRKIAVCAGSGGSLFKNVDVDLLFTGELSHHEALAAKEKGISTIACFHTNTERGFLAAVMQVKLQDALAEEWAKVESSEKGTAEGFEVMVSQADRDPYEIM